MTISLAISKQGFRLTASHGARLPGNSPGLQRPHCRGTSESEAGSGRGSPAWPEPPTSADVWGARNRPRGCGPALRGPLSGVRTLAGALALWRAARPSLFLPAYYLSFGGGIPASAVDSGWFSSWVLAAGVGGSRRGGLSWPISFGGVAAWIEHGGCGGARKGCGGLPPSSSRLALIVGGCGRR